jgi:hypothetical protein
MVHFGSTGGNLTVKAVNGCGNSPLRYLGVAMPCRTEEHVAFDLFAVYPNPTGAQVNVVLPAFSGAARIQITDAFGRVLQQADIDEATKEHNSVPFDTRSYAAGIYHAVFESGTQRRVVKFVKH